MRIGASILLDGPLCLQTHGWENYRPVGHISAAFEFYNQNKVDEVFVIGVPSEKNIQNSAELNARVLSQNQIATPVIYGGGLHSSNIDSIISMAACDRYSISSCLVEGDYQLAMRITEVIGKQALVGCLPFRQEVSGFKFYNTTRESWSDLSVDQVEKIYSVCDEIILYDINHDGCAKGYDFSILEAFQVDRSKTIICGGVGKTEIRHAKIEGIAAVYIENRHLHHE